MKRRYYIAGACLVAVAAALFAFALPRMPAEVAVHWNAHGQPDGYGSPWTLFLLGPGLMAGTLALFAALPWLSPKRFGVEETGRAYLHLMLIILALLGYVFAVAIYAAVSGPVDVSRALIGGLCVMAILIGNLLGKVRRNFFIGIRTPWTLASERVWYGTHRLAGKVVVASGVVALVAMLAGAPQWLAFTVVIAGFLAPVLYSLILYKRLEREHALDVAA
jgi:uncharacterized membrane protein